MDWPERDPHYDHVSIGPGLDLEFSMEGSSRLRRIWAVSSVVLYPTDRVSEYDVEIKDKFFGFYTPYLSQECININRAGKYTLLASGQGNAYNWIVCEPVGKKTDKGTHEINVLKKIGVLRTDSVSELLVGGDNRGSMLEQIDCEIV